MVPTVPTKVHFLDPDANVVIASDPLQVLSPIPDDEWYKCRCPSLHPVLLPPTPLPLFFSSIPSTPVPTSFGMRSSPLVPFSQDLWLPDILSRPLFPHRFPKARGQPVASGTFGDTHEATHNDSKVRIKSLRMDPGGDLRAAGKTLRNAAALWKRLAHPNIVPLRGVTTEPPQLISDWMPNGNVNEYLKLHPDADRLSLLSDTAEGMEDLHSRGIIHGNLKPANILIDTNHRARIADFGLSGIMRVAKPTASGGGSLRWTAPELLELERGASTGASDVYAFGMVALEVLAGVFPFANSPPTTVAVDVLSGKRPERPNHPALTDELWDLIQRCWDQVPQRRPGISDVACHLRSIVRQNRGDYLHDIPADGKYEYSIGSNGSEISIHSVRFRELGRPLGGRKTPSGSCGLFRGAAFWKPSRRALSTRDCYYGPDVPSEKALF